MKRAYTKRETLIQAKQRTGAAKFLELGLTPEFTKSGRLTATSTRQLISRKIFWSADVLDWIERS